MSSTSERAGEELVRYARSTVVLHWLVAFALTVAVVLGLVLGNTPDEASTRRELFNWHRWVGVAVFALVLGRIVVRASNRTPPPLPSIPSFQQWVAHFTHGSLYVLMLAAPLTGYLLSNRMGEAIVLFGSVTLPPLVAADQAQMALMESVHKWINYSLIGIAILHILAAFKHHLVDRDATLRRMWLR